MTNAGKWVWLIGGSQMSEPMAQEIKRRGYKLLLSDKNPDAHCKQYATHFLKRSVYDTDWHYKWASLAANDGKSITQGDGGMLHGKDIAAVLCIGCDAGPTVSAVSEALGHFERWPSYSSAVLTKNKAALRNAIGSSYPLWVKGQRFQDQATILKKWQDLTQAHGVAQFPMAVKAIEDQGSRGFEVWRSEADITDREPPYLIEQYLEGVDVSALTVLADFDTSEAAFDFLVEDSRVYWLNGALRMFWRDRPGIEAGHVNPFFADGNLTEIAQDTATKLGIKRGILKIDVKHTSEGWALLEAATRPSGGYDHMYTSDLAVEGLQVMRCTDAILDLALGERIHPLNRYRQVQVIGRHKTVVCLAPILEPGYIESIDVPSTCDKVFTVKDEIKPLVSNQDRPVFILAAGDNLREAYQRASETAQGVKVKYRE